MPAYRVTLTGVARSAPRSTRYPSQELRMGRTAGIWPYICLGPALAVFFLLEIVPAFATSIFSLTDYTGLPGTPINWVGLDNYTSLLAGQQSFMVRALGVTAIFSLVVTVVQNGVAVLVA